MDYRISIEEFETQAEIMEMARNLIREAMQETKEPESLLVIETETIEMPF